MYVDICTVQETDTPPAVTSIHNMQGTNDSCTPALPSTTTTTTTVSFRELLPIPHRAKPISTRAVQKSHQLLNLQATSQ